MRNSREVAFSKGAAGSCRWGLHNAAEGDIVKIAKIMSKVGLALLALAVVTAGTAAFAGERQGPRISVKESNFDFGTVSPGSQPEHIFEIKNVGDEVLDIQRVQPT